MRLIDADALLSECKLAQKQASYDRQYANAFYSASGDISTEWWCVEDIIEDAPTIEPQPHWIPCSERLPEKKGIYPVWTAVGFGNHLSSSYWDGEEWTLRVDAWALLPPYREEADE